MHLLFSGEQLISSIAQATCWMLVHSLWIGIALAVVTGAIMMATKKRSAALRYNLLAASLLLFVAATLSVFIFYFNLNTSGAVPEVKTVAVTAANTVNPTTDITVTMGLTEAVNAFLTKYANLIVFIWFLIIAFRMFRFFAGMRSVHRLRNTQLSFAGDDWNKKLLMLSASLNIKKKVLLFQSGIAKIPMAAGHLKPVILFPVGLLTTLPADEVEAILIHELAHIRRQDYLVNMLQSFVAIIFFFNPAVLWISSLIKIERENCCDDIAVAHTGDKRNYINALVSFQQYHLNTAQYATALTGRKDHLFQRVKRMLHNNNKTLNGMEKTVLTLCLIITASVTFIFSQAQSGKLQHAEQSFFDTTKTLKDRRFDPKDFTEGAIVSYSETINGIQHSLQVGKINGVLYSIYGDVAWFKINNETVLQEQWGKYSSIFKRLKNKAVQPEHTVIKEDPVISSPEIPEPAGPAEAYAQDAAAYRQASAEYAKAEMERRSEDATKMEADSKRADAEAARVAKRTEKITTETTQSDGVKTGLSYRVNDNLNNNQSHRQTVIQHSGNVNADFNLEAYNKEFISDLISNRIIKNTDGLSYSINNESFIVNGNVQPAVIHQKFKEKYIKSSDWKLLYNSRD
jgi:bla regulator protein BlaR1